MVRSVGEGGCNTVVGYSSLQDMRLDAVASIEAGAVVAAVPEASLD